MDDTKDYQGYRSSIAVDLAKPGTDHSVAMLYAGETWIALCGECNEPAVTFDCDHGALCAACYTKK